MQLSKLKFKQMNANERRVLRRVALGWSNKRIAAVLKMKPESVSQVRGKLAKKFGAGRTRNSARTNVLSTAYHVAKRSNWI